MYQNKYNSNDIKFFFEKRIYITCTIDIDVRDLILHTTYCKKKIYRIYKKLREKNINLYFPFTNGT